MEPTISAPFAFVNSGTSLPRSEQSISVGYMKKDAGSRSAKPTQEDLRAAARLKALWDKRQEPKISQVDAAEKMRMTQPAVSQYLLGKIPLGFDALMKFSRLLGVDPELIRNDLPEQQHILRGTLAIDSDDTTAWQLTLGSLITAMVANMPDAAEDFAVLLKARADAQGFPTETADFVKEALRTVELGQRKAVGAVRNAWQHAAARKAN